MLPAREMIMTNLSPVLTCPKCRSSLVSYERNGVTIEQCEGCRGIFLDRGELEHLIEAEKTFNDSRGYDPRAGSWPIGGDRHGSGHGDRGYGHGRSGHDNRGRRGFLGGLFD